MRLGISPWRVCEPARPDVTIGAGFVFGEPFCLARVSAFRNVLRIKS